MRNWRYKVHRLRMALCFWWLNRHLDYLEWRIALGSLLRRTFSQKGSALNNHGGDHVVLTVPWIHDARPLLRSPR